MLTWLFLLVSIAQETPKEDGDKLAERALERVNVHRKNAGLEPVTMDAKLSDGCKKHALYLASNSGKASVEKNPHTEDSGSKGYTAEGKRSAASSDIHWGQPDRAVDDLVATFYHRLPILDPQLKHIGVGFAKGGKYGAITVLDIKQGKEGTWEKTPEAVLYPVDGQKGVGAAFVQESPDPFPKGAAKSGGYPITVQFPPGTKVNEVKAVLKEDGGAEIACHLSTPEKPARKDFPQQEAICLIPKVSLKGTTTYKVSVNCKVNGADWKKDWSFTTE